MTTAKRLVWPDITDASPPRRASPRSSSLLDATHRNVPHRTHAMTTTPDTLSKAGAKFLAAQLDAWWHATGALHVRHWIEPGGKDRTSQGDPAANDTGDTRAVWVVRCNLIRGSPPPR